MYSPSPKTGKIQSGERGALSRLWAHMRHRGVGQGPSGSGRVGQTGKICRITNASEYLVMLSTDRFGFSLVERP